MKTITKITAAALAISAMSATLAQAASTTGTATVSIVTPISIVQTAAMNFGTISSSSTAGTVNTAGVVTGGVTKIANGNHGVFRVTGTPNAVFYFSQPTTVTLTNGANSMNATTSVQLATFGPLSSTGTRDVTVTATLAVAANQPAGTYNGTYNATANY